MKEHELQKLEERYKNWATEDLLRATKVDKDNYQPEAIELMIKELDRRNIQTQIIEVEAETLEEARNQVKSQMPEDFPLLSEEVISDGTPKTVRAIAETTDAAFVKAQSQIPANKSVLEKREVSAPGQKVIIVEAFDEQSAKVQTQNQIGDTAIIKALKLTASGKKGFLGIGKTPHRYEAELLQQAIVEVTYKTKAKISVKIRKAFFFICGNCKKISAWNENYHQDYSPGAPPSASGIPDVCYRAFCPKCGHLIAELANDEMVWVEEARPIKAGEKPHSIYEGKGILQPFAVPYASKTLNINEYHERMATFFREKKEEKKAIQEKESSDQDRLWPLVESSPVNREHEFWDSLDKQMARLGVSGEENIRKGLASVTDSSHWIHRTRRCRGTHEAIRNFVLSLISAYNERVKVKQVTFELEKGEDSRLHADNIDIRIVTPSVVVPIIILRPQKKLFYCLYFEPSD